MPARRSWLVLLSRIALAALYGLVAAFTVTIVSRDPAFALAGDAGGLLTVELAAGAALLLAGLALIRPGGRCGILLAAAAIAWPLAEWNSPAAGAAFTPGLVLYAAWAPLLAAAALRGPDERRLTRPALALVAVAVVTCVGMLGVGAAAVLDPAASGCSQCPPNRVLVHADADAGAHEGLMRAGLVLTAAWTAAFALLALVRFVRSTGPRRRLAATVLAPAAAALALLGADAVHGARRGFLSNDPTDRALWAAELAALSIVACGIASERRRAHRRRRALARLVLDLGAGALQTRLAAMLGDPSLSLLHALDGETGWIDADGRPATPSGGDDREVTFVAVGGRRISALVHAVGLLDDPTILAQLESTARLALEHDRLLALRQAQLRALRAASARIVDRADAERRRLERDLHDGAQQRLVAAAIGVRLARRHHAGDAALETALADVEAELNDTVGDLRRLAHGVFPAALDSDGLAAAVEVLAVEEPRLVCGQLPDGRFAAPVESAAYHLVDQALQMAAAGEVAVDARRLDGQLLVEVHAASGFGALPVRVADRIGAAGGTVAADSQVVRAELPCGS